VSKSTSENVGD